jgi:hypothetical protein
VRGLLVHELLTRLYRWPAPLEAVGVRCLTL